MKQIISKLKQMVNGVVHHLRLKSPSLSPTLAHEAFIHVVDDPSVHCVAANPDAETFQDTPSSWSTESDLEDELDDTRLLEYLSGILGVPTQTVRDSSQCELDYMISEYRTMADKLHQKVMAMND